MKQHANPKNRGISAALNSAIRACAELARKGCTIERVLCEDRNPRITIKQPPTRARIDGHVKTRTTDRITYVANQDGCQIEWQTRRIL